ncbi:hypothetical protein [Nakamurella lactea]|uniref:hypothetical protein n=1 Tax=Nakamurella lactea TaxID=459515 RepID=UPI0012B5B556|nr:hypothetical protein [Nakamurella lactea]
MRFKIDTNGVTLIVGGVETVTDRETNAPVLDRESGKPLFTVHLMAVEAGEKPDQLSIRIPGQPAGVGLGSQVRVHDLVARTWEMGDRHGLSFRARVIEPVGPDSSRRAPEARAA